jgi:sugar phosphate isomerase/epimerase
MGMTRREVLLAAAAAMQARAAAHGMKLHLSCGAIGIKASPQQALDYAARHGFDAIDADANAISILTPAEMKARNVGWGLAGLPVDFRRDDARFREGMAAFPDYARKLKAAGVDRMTTWVSPASRELTYLANFKQHAARLGEVARVLNDSGLRFGLEYVGPKTSWTAQRYAFIHSLREMRELIAELKSPNAGLVMDSWHGYTAGDTRDDILALNAAAVVSVDLNDAPSGIPVDQQVDSRRELPAATGVIDVKTFLTALKTIGFDGPVRAEPFNEALRKMAPEDALAATIASLKKAFALL